MKRNRAFVLRRQKCAWMILMTAVLIFILQFSVETVQAEAPELITAQLTNEGKTVKLTVNIAQNSQITSGRIKVHYPPELLKFIDAVEGGLWAIEDINASLTERGQNVTAYAWADTRKLDSAGTLLTMCWEAQEAANGQEVTVETEIVELYFMEEPIEVTSDWILNRLRLEFGGISFGGYVRTGDDSSVVGDMLLCLGALLVLAQLIQCKIRE